MDDRIRKFMYGRYGPDELSTDGHTITVSTKGTEDSNVIETISSVGANISNEVDTSCSSATKCTIVVPESKGSVKFRFNSSAFDITLGESLINSETVLSASSNLFIKVPLEEDGHHEDGDHFDGRAYLIWSCKNGGICMKHFDDIPNFDDGNSKFYKASEIVDERTGEAFDVNASYKGWATDNKFNDWVDAYKEFKNIEGDIDWATVKPQDMLGEPIDMRQYEEQAIEAGACTKNNTPQDVFESCVDHYAITQGVWAARVQLQPLGEPTYNNAYVSYGDRNFKVVVYNDNYKGISIGDLSELNYYPAQWNNAYLRRDQFDISGTTKDNPTLLDAILLESTLNIKVLDYNGFEITKLEALDVPKDAVDISKVNGEWKLVFSSNFYDNVLFKATDADGEESYFKIKRYTIDGWIRYEDNHPILTADFFFDRQKSYSDFELTAKIVYKDGTEKSVKLKPVKRIDDGLGNITREYEIDEQTFGDEDMPKGKGLKRAVFEYDLEQGEDRKIKNVYLNAEFKGSSATTYAGTFSGSGKGVLANIYNGEGE